MTKFSDEDVLKLARLSRLQLSKTEVETFKNELSAIVGYVQQLQKVDVSGLQPTSQVTGLTDVVRADEVVEYGVSTAELLKNAPSIEQNQFKVKRMVG
jgi:aspartyl-tRNA(Asn)/glutamyl-tRNA(Gln) amidotransferase subunit C